VGRARCGDGRGLGSWQVTSHLVEVPELLPQLLAALVQRLALQAAQAWQENLALSPRRQSTVYSG
jgi:hypothetical protein